MLGGVRAVVKAGAVDKVRVGHPECLRPRVHHGGKGALASGDVLRQRAGAVVCRRHDHGLEHLRQRKLLVLLQIDLTAALGGGRGGGRYGVVP